MPCECLSAYDSWFVLNFIVILLRLLIDCNGCQKKEIILNNLRNPFQQEFSYMHNL
jgi:hypothetical protein